MNKNLFFMLAVTLVTLPGCLKKKNQEVAVETVDNTTSADVKEVIEQE